MSTLKQKAESILNEKIQKLVPENIKEGVQILDVVGTHEGTTDEVVKTWGKRGFTVWHENYTSGASMFPPSLISAELHKTSFLGADCYGIHLELDTSTAMQEYLFNKVMLDVTYNGLSEQYMIYVDQSTYSTLEYSIDVPMSYSYDESIINGKITAIRFIYDTFETEIYEFGKTIATLDTEPEFEALKLTWVRVVKLQDDTSVLKFGATSTPECSNRVINDGFRIKDIVATVHMYTGNDITGTYGIWGSIGGTWYRQIDITSSLDGRDIAGVTGVTFHITGYYQ